MKITIFFSFLFYIQKAIYFYWLQRCNNRATKDEYDDVAIMFSNLWFSFLRNLLSYARASNGFLKNFTIFIFIFILFVCRSVSHCYFLLKLFVTFHFSSTKTTTKNVVLLCVAVECKIAIKSRLWLDSNEVFNLFKWWSCQK